ncbi:hypothetical protein PHYBOEH_008277 [Phytophthora boehmeriae]|uniref:Uncharacterized protein n=1 Tax=Phytophthora boehmeriae TaxID=109152 RepID=A0A8T1X2Z0_9STRA|nr:hypothetical protein PHYBOEH_008277 [Phytophthora boehmeriae]
MRRRREAKEAQRKQEQLDAKQKILLYKLRKEQEAMLLERTAFAQDGVGEETSPTPKEDFIERSRIAIEHAKAKRLRLQQIEERKKKQVQLPPRPDNNAGEGSPSTPTATLLFNATEASRARDLSKEELRKRARQRARQGAHDDYIPGEKALPDVKVKSFGHIPIQPRAVPSWRKNI